MMKKVVSVVLCLVLMLGVIAGCGNNDSGTTSDGRTVIKLMGPFSGENSDIGRETLKKLEDKFNVKIEISAPPGDNFTESVQLSINDSKSRPDAILFNDTNESIIRSAVEQGTFVEITDLVKNAENLQKYTLPSSWAAMDYKQDGKIYGVVRSTTIRADGFMIRKDWLDKLGITGVEEAKPITMEKFKEILEKFSNGDPNGNGQKVYGLTMWASGSDGLIPLYKPANYIDTLSGYFNMLGWQKAKDGEGYAYMDPKFSKVDPAFKDFMSFLREAVQDKWIDPEWPSINEKKATDNFNAGKYGVRWAFPGHVAGVQTQLEKIDPNAELIWVSGIANPNYDNRAVGTTYSTGAWGGWYILNKDKAAKIVEILDYMLSDEFYYDQLVYGGEGTGFTVDANGDKQPTELYLDTTPGKGGMGYNTAFMRRAADAAVFINLKQDPAERKQIEGWIDIAVDNLVLSLDNGYVPQVSLEQKFQEYQAKMNASIADIVLGKAEVSAYDDALAKWYDNMGKEYVEEMNAYIEKNAK